HGHSTAFGQMAAKTLHVPARKIELRMNDSSLPGYSIGTFGSRITQTAGSVVLLAAEAARDKALQVASRVLEAAPQDLVIEDGKVMVRGVPARSVELGELARLAAPQPGGPRPPPRGRGRAPRRATPHNRLVQAAAGQ